MEFAGRTGATSSWATDDELVAGVRAGDERSFERLVKRYRGPLIGYVGSRVGDRELAEDIAQEIFMSALRGMRTSERPIAFRPWVYEIARNACIDRHRWSGRNVELASLTEDLVQLSPKSDPQAAFELRQRLNALCQAFGALPPLERELLGLRELCGLPYTELASCTGLSVGAVESALHRARRRLHAQYRLLTGERGPRPAVPAERRAVAAPGRAPLWDTPASSGRGAGW